MVWTVDTERRLIHRLQFFFCVYIFFSFFLSCRATRVLSDNNKFSSGWKCVCAQTHKPLFVSFNLVSFDKRRQYSMHLASSVQLTAVFSSLPVFFFFIISTQYTRIPMSMLNRWCACVCALSHLWVFVRKFNQFWNSIESFCAIVLEMDGNDKLPKTKKKQQNDWIMIAVQ